MLLLVVGVITAACAGRRFDRRGRRLSVRYRKCVVITNY